MKAAQHDIDRLFGCLFDVLNDSDNARMGTASHDDNTSIHFNWDGLFGRIAAYFSGRDYPLGDDLIGGGFDDGSRLADLSLQSGLHSCR